MKQRLNSLHKPTHSFKTNYKTYIKQPTQPQKPTNTYNKFAQCDVPNAIHNINAIENDIAIYPNPVTDKLHIQLKGDVVEKEIQSIALYNLLGQQVYHSDKFVQTISLQNLAKGNYVFTIQTSSKSFSTLINKN